MSVRVNGSGVNFYSISIEQNWWSSRVDPVNDFPTFSVSFDTDPLNLLLKKEECFKTDSSIECFTPTNVNF